MWIDQRGSEVLTRNECVRLLAVGAGGVGRLGLVDDDRVVIQPVNYRVLDGDVLIQIGPGSMLEAARHQSIVSFEIDQVGAPGSPAWGVLVQGLATVVDGEAGVEEARPTQARPLVPEPGTSLVRIRTGVLSGRRFLLPAALARSAAGSPGSVPPAASVELASLALPLPTRLSRASTVREVAEAMRRQHVSAVLLDEHPPCLVTEADLADALAAGLDGATPAIEVATKSAVWATTSSTVADAAAMMSTYGVRHLVVLDSSGVAVGTLSLLDVVRSLLDTSGAGRRGAKAPRR
ncbi:MAG: pyridoxamine 5'-phosphate oxidase family protein [Actinomycetota bacterium]|nr:pyridoxamine 5'-phosphate oxidase family protein [Actinomycetota bacterium]MDQ6947582.1 pyridoxamine 5'-phosphate oxidase family protein [Actinomycetota bacterium]